MSNFKEGSLEIIFTEGGKNNITWIGKSEDRDPSAVLNPYLEGLIEKIKGKELEIDFQKLEYMNSSTVPPVIGFIKLLNSENITSVVYYDKNSKWQSASFKALETIACTLKSITIEGK